MSVEAEWVMWTFTFTWQLHSSALTFPTQTCPKQNKMKQTNKQTSTVKTEGLKKNQSLITKYGNVQVSVENYLSYQESDLE